MEFNNASGNEQFAMQVVASSPEVEVGEAWQFKLRRAVHDVFEEYGVAQHKREGLLQEAEQFYPQCIFLGQSPDQAIKNICGKIRTDIRLETQGYEMYGEQEDII